MSINELLHARACTCPETPAIIDTRRGRSRTLSFADLDLAAGRAAALLLQEGLRPGDRVLVLHPMAGELYVALAAIFRLGLTAMFLDPSTGRQHIDRCCALVAPRALIGSARAHLLRLLSPALQRIPVKFCIGPSIPGAVPWSRASRLAPYEPIQPCPPETPALLTFTSGSTGDPKAAVRSHGFLLAQHQALEQSLGLTPGEVDLTALPIFVLANLASGVTSLIPDADLRRPGAVDPAPLVAQIQVHRPTRTVASPAFLEPLANYCIQRRLTFPSLKKVFSGGAPVFPDLLDKLQAVAPQADIVAVYGSTEAEPIAFVGRHEIARDDVAGMLGGRGLLTGTPVSSIHLRILGNNWGRPIGPYSRAQFAAACLRPGEAGEIVVSGGHVLPGYLHGHGDEETKFAVDGTLWHRTGDAGYLDDRGRVWLLGRCAARIEDSRGTLYPFMVECTARHYPGVRHAAVASCSGRRILAIQLEEYAANTDLTALAQELAWASIDEIQVYKHIPVDKRHNAKIDYPALHRLIDKGGHSVCLGRRPPGNSPQ